MRAGGVRRRGGAQGEGGGAPHRFQLSVVSRDDGPGKGQGVFVPDSSTRSSSVLPCCMLTPYKLSTYFFQEHDNNICRCVRLCKHGL